MRFYDWLRTNIQPVLDDGVGSLSFVVQFDSDWPRGAQTKAEIHAYLDTFLSRTDYGMRCRQSVDDAWERYTKAQAQATVHPTKTPRGKPR